MSRVIDEHRQYLADARRVEAYRAAIARTVKPGDVVLDLASGTGVLGLLACEAGAARVYAIDGGGMAHVAQAIAQANGLDGRVHVIDGLSTLVELPERADVLVTDQIGHFGFEFDLVALVADARRRMLKPDARLIPATIDLMVGVVESPEVADAVAFWSARPAGFTMEPLREMAANSGYPRRLEASDVLAFAPGGSIDLARDAPSIAVDAEIAIDRAGTIRGLAGWFSAQLTDTVTLTNSPLSADRIQRRCVVLPVERSVAVHAGDRVSVTMRILPSDLLMNWTVRVFRRGSSAPCTTFQHSTLRGMLLSPQMVRTTKPDYRPTLTPRGAARRSVLELCDGSRTLTAIEQEIFERHRHLFRDRSDAAVFVAEVVSGYTK